jgi:glycosyltransferase involved in cell wall biosynthesis
MSLERLLFASVHSYLDPSSGAALATRDLLELLCARGVACRALTTGVLDYERETSLEEVLILMGLPFQRAEVSLGHRGSAIVLDLERNGVRLRLLPTASSRIERSPDEEEAAVFLALAEEALDRFAPQVLLTYGGHPANRALMALARRRGIPVVFHLHNLAYVDRAIFTDVTAALVPSDFARRVYARRLGLDCTVIPHPVRPDRVVAADRQPQYLMFINPQPAKGVTVFARIAAELGRRRPEIPLLVVEGRATSDWLDRLPLDLSGLTNLNRMANNPDPRQFYGVTRALLVPSLVSETFGRVAAEALANGIPVLASDRGALPEVLGDAGLIFAIPDRCTPESPVVPSPREVAPWNYALERLWDDPAFEAKHCNRALREAGRWNPDNLIERYEEFFGRLAADGGPHEVGFTSETEVMSDEMVPVPLTALGAGLLTPPSSAALGAGLPTPPTV